MLTTVGLVRGGLDCSAMVGWILHCLLSMGKFYPYNNIWSLLTIFFFARIVDFFFYSNLLSKHNKENLLERLTTNPICRQESNIHCDVVFKNGEVYLVGTLSIFHRKHLHGILKNFNTIFSHMEWSILLVNLMCISVNHSDFESIPL